MIRGPLKIGISHISIYIYIRVGLTASKHLIVRAFGQKFGKIGQNTLATRRPR